MDSRRLDWKLARVIGSNMVEIRDVTVASDIFAATLFTLHSEVTKLWILKFIWKNRMKMIRQNFWRMTILIY